MRELFDLLSAHIEASTWWPGESRFEIAIGAVLVQNTNWTNAEAALANLRAASLIDPRKLVEVDEAHVGELIRPSGYYNIKAGYLTTFSQWFIHCDHEVAAMTDTELRSSLLGLRGIGPETADVIGLYVYRRGTFIYDAYARRLLAAAGYGTFTTYQQAKRVLDERVAEARFKIEEFALFHGLIVDGSKAARRVGGWENAYPLLASGTFMAATSHA